MVDPSTVSCVQKYLRSLQENGIPVGFGVVFGSHATGRPNAWSDIDLLVVSPHFDEPFGREEVNQLWCLAARIDSRIEPIPCGEREWERDDSRAVIEIARRGGVRVDPAERVAEAEEPHPQPR